MAKKHSGTLTLISVPRTTKGPLVESIHTHAVAPSIVEQCRLRIEQAKAAASYELIQRQSMGLSPRYNPETKQFEYISGSKVNETA